MDTLLPLPKRGKQKPCPPGDGQITFSLCLPHTQRLTHTLRLIDLSFSAQTYTQTHFIIKMNTGFYEPFFTSRIIESILHANKWQLNRPITKLLKDIISQRHKDKTTSYLRFWFVCLVRCLTSSVFAFSLLFELICFEISLVYPDVKVTYDQVSFAQTSTYTHVVSSDVMRLMDGSREKTDGQMNLICLNAGELWGGRALHQCITTPAMNACIKVNKLPINNILQFALIRLL